MAMGSGSGGGSMSDINVTPLVDVMLVLLIIFMITAPMLNNAGVDVDLPREEAPPLDPAEEQIVLGIDKDLSFFINDSRFEQDELQTRLKAIATANPDLPVFLKADGSVPYRNVAAVMAAAKRAGIPRVGLVFDPSGASSTEAKP